MGDGGWRDVSLFTLSTQTNGTSKTTSHFTFYMPAKVAAHSYEYKAVDHTVSSNRRRLRVDFFMDPLQILQLGGESARVVQL